MMEDLKHLGTVQVDRERLKMEAKTSVNWSAQFLSTLPGIPSGPAAFLGFTLRNTLLTSSLLTVSVRLSVGGDGVSLCLCLLKTCKKIIKLLSQVTADAAS